MERGIDVSAYQPKPRWLQVAAAGASFAIVKLTDGNHYINPFAKEQIRGALAAGLLVMLYHYAEPNGPDWVGDAIAEEEHLLSLVEDLEKEFNTRFFCWLDTERNTPLTGAEIPNFHIWVDTFRNACALRGRNIGWYSYKDFTNSLGLDSTWTNHLLWLARYPIPFLKDGNYIDRNGNPVWVAGHDALGNPTDKVPLPWARADLWQDGGDANHASWPGIDGPCDCNLFAGTLEQLQELLGVLPLEKT